MQLIGRIVGAVLFALVSFGSAVAQPANNNFAAAFVTSGNIVITNGTTIGASKEAGEPNHAGNQGGNSVWYNWTPSKSGEVAAFLSDTSFFPLLAVYTGNAVNALTQVGSSQGGGFIQFRVTAGTTYRIAVDAFRFGNNNGTFALNLYVLAAVNVVSPTNNATVYAPNPVTVVVDAEVLNPPVLSVDLYRNSSLLATSTDESFTFLVAQPLFGTNLFTAVAIDSVGQSWTSAVHRVLPATRSSSTAVATPVQSRSSR